MYKYVVSGRHIKDKYWASVSLLCSVHSFSHSHISDDPQTYGRNVTYLYEINKMIVSLFTVIFAWQWSKGDVELFVNLVLFKYQA